MKIKVIQGIFKQNIKPKWQIKWEEQYGGNIDWTQIWTKLKKIRVITKLPNTEQSSKGKGKTHKSTNRQNQSTTGKQGKPQWP